MIKPLGINPIRGAFYSLIVATPLLVGCGGNYSSNAQEINQTEVVSRQVSDAIRVNALGNTQLPSFKYDPHLLNRFIQCHQNPDEYKKALSAAADAYKNLNADVATCLIQNHIDRVNMYDAMDHFAYWSDGSGKTKGTEYKEIPWTELDSYAADAVFHNNQVVEWMNNEYSVKFGELFDKYLYGKKNPGYDDVSYALDLIIKRSPYHTADNIREYEKEVSRFEKRLNGNSSKEAISELLAFKTFLIDKMAFENETIYGNKTTVYKGKHDNGWRAFSAPKGLEYFPSYMEKYYTEYSKPTYNVKPEVAPSLTTSYEHNKKLDDRVLACAVDKKDANELKDIMKQMYKENGTFLSTLELQHYVDRINMVQALEHFAFWHLPFTKGKELDRSVLELYKDNEAVINANKVIDWMYDEYYEYAQAEEQKYLYDNNYTSGENVSKFCDDFINNSPYHTDSDRKDYYRYLESFKKGQSGKNNIENLSELISFKVYITELLAFNNMTAFNKTFDNYFLSEYSNGSRADNGPDNLKYFDEYMDKYFNNKSMPKL